MQRDPALAAWAARAPEAPFAFFRGPRGHFDWISFEDAEAHRQGTPRRPRWLPADLLDLLRFASDVEAPAASAALPPGPSRPVWIAWRPLATAEEAALAAWALRSGAAIVVERHDRIPLDLVAWARPTVVSETADAVADLLAGLERDAPKWLRRRWLRQRLGRLRCVLVESPPVGASSVASIESIGDTLRRLVPAGGVRVESFSSAAVSALV